MLLENNCRLIISSEYNCDFFKLEQKTKSPTPCQRFEMGVNSLRLFVSRKFHRKIVEKTINYYFVYDFEIYMCLIDVSH